MCVPDSCRCFLLQHSVLSLQLERGSKFIKCLNLGQEIFLLIASRFPRAMCAGGVKSKMLLHSCCGVALPSDNELFRG